MEGEGAWRGLKGAFKRLFLKKRSEPLTTQGSSSSSSSSSRNSSFRSALNGDDNESFVRDTPKPTPETRRNPRSTSDLANLPIQDPLRYPKVALGPQRSLQRRESRSLSPRLLHGVGNKNNIVIKPIIKGSRALPAQGDDEVATGSGEGDRSSRPKNRVTISLRESVSPIPPYLAPQYRSCSEERTSSEGNSEQAAAGGGGSTCLAEQRLETLFSDRGYHVKSLMSNKVLEERIMQNIHRRERIAIMMRNEAAAAAGCTNTITTADELSTMNKPPPRPKSLPIPTGTVIDPVRLQHVLGLVSKVWTKRDGSASQAARMPSTRVAETSRLEFVQDCLRAHNEYRELHGAPPLLLCDKLCEDAQIWAAHLASTGTIQYSSIDGRGENIMSTATGRGGLTGEGVTKAWYEKGRKYNYNMPETADLAYAGSFSQVIWKSTRHLGVGMARDEDGRVVAVTRYYPKGNVPGQIKSNVLPLLQVNPFDLPTYSKTREEAILDVQTAMIAPEVCLSVAKNYAIVTKALINNPKMAAAHAKITGVRTRRKRKAAKEAKKVKKEAAAKGKPTPPALCPNGRLIPICCGPPTLPEATPPTSIRAPRENLQLLSPLSLATDGAYKNLNPPQNLSQAGSSRQSGPFAEDADLFSRSRLEFRTNYDRKQEVSIGAGVSLSNNSKYSVRYNDRPRKVTVLPIRTEHPTAPGALALS